MNSDSACFGPEESRAYWEEFSKKRSNIVIDENIETIMKPLVLQRSLIEVFRKVLEKIPFQPVTISHSSQFHEKLQDDSNDLIMLQTELADIYNIDLPSVYDMLFRDRYFPNTRFTDLGEIAQFEYRLDYHTATELFYTMLLILESELKGAKVESLIPRPSELKPYELLTAKKSAVLRFSGVPSSSSPTTFARVYREILNFLRTLNSSKQRQIAAVLGISLVQNSYAVKHEVKLNDGSRHKVYEPLFKSLMGYNGAVKGVQVDECIAALLVTPHPLNLMIYYTSYQPVERCQVDSVLGVSRLLEALSLPLSDTGVTFTAPSIRSQKLSREDAIKVSMWSTRPPQGRSEPTTAEIYAHLLPARRLLRQVMNDRHSNDFIRQLSEQAIYNLLRLETRSFDPILEGIFKDTQTASPTRNDSYVASSSNLSARVYGCGYIRSSSSAQILAKPSSSSTSNTNSASSHDVENSNRYTTALSSQSLCHSSPSLTPSIAVVSAGANTKNLSSSSNHSKRGIKRFIFEPSTLSESRPLHSETGNIHTNSLIANLQDGSYTSAEMAPSSSATHKKLFR